MMDQQSGYLTPEDKYESNSGSDSEYCPSGKGQAKPKAKPKAKSKKKPKKNKALSTPSVAQSSQALGLRLPDLTPLATGQDAHPSNHNQQQQQPQQMMPQQMMAQQMIPQQMIPQQMMQQDFNVLNPLPDYNMHSLNNFNSLAMPLGLLPGLQNLNGSLGFDLGPQMGGLQSSGFWQPGLQGLQGTNNKVPMGFDMGMGMGMGFWANPATGGYVPPANPELSDALAREIESFELDFKRQLEEGAGTYKTVAPSAPADSAGPSSAGEETKPEPTMDDPFAPSTDRESTVASHRGGSKSKGSFKGSSKASANASTIPLVCMLCENSPKFSDVSHLLTHVSSKGHLSRRFSLKMKKDGDAAVDLQIQRYDAWVERYGIKQLLQNRQEAKEQKKSTQLKRQRGPAKDVSAGPSDMASRDIARQPLSPNADQPVTQKKKCHISVATESFKMEPEDDPRMPSGLLNPLNQIWKQDVSFDTAFQTPSNNRFRSMYPDPDTPPKPVVQENEPQNEPVETLKPAGSRTPTLKGVRYVGMGIFDAGTPDMKRMRNQRKDPSVVVNMALVSASIDEIEQVWNSTMTVVDRTRSVYDSPTEPSDEISPDDDADAQPAAKKPRAARAATKGKPRAKAKVKIEREESLEPTGSPTLRLTRSAARAMARVSTQNVRGRKQKGGKRGTKKAPGEDDLESDGELDNPLRTRHLDVYRGHADEGSLGEDMLGGRRETQGFAGDFFGGHLRGFPSRTAMQGLPSNRPLSSIYGRRNGQQLLNLGDKENDGTAFSMQQSVTDSMQSGSWQFRQNPQPTGYNPLSLQQTNSYNQVYGTAFDEPKPSNSPFENMSGLANNSFHGINALSGSLQSSLGNHMGGGMMHGLTNGLASGLANGLHNGMSLDGSINNNNNNNNTATTTTTNNNHHHNGLQYQPVNHQGQDNGFNPQ